MLIAQNNLVVLVLLDFLPNLIHRHAGHGGQLFMGEGAIRTATHFILRKYKEKHLIFERQEQQEKEWIFS